jgi:hypothetical protein
MVILASLSAVGSVVASIPVGRFGESDGVYKDGKESKAPDYLKETYTCLGTVTVLASWYWSRLLGLHECPTVLRSTKSTRHPTDVI